MTTPFSTQNYEQSKHFLCRRSGPRKGKKKTKKKTFQKLQLFPPVYFDDANARTKIKLKCIRNRFEI